jgi:hypothetical protein
MSTYKIASNIAHSSYMYPPTFLHKYLGMNLGIGVFSTMGFDRPLHVPSIELSFNFDNIRKFPFIN